MSIQLTGTELVNTLLLERQQDPRLAIVVEGDEECQLLDSHVNVGTAKTLAGGSKSAVLEAAEELAQEGVDWAVGVVDADFTRLGLQPARWPTPALTTRQYDLMMEVLVRHPHLLRRVAISNSAPGTVAAFEQVSSKSLYETVVEIAHPIGVLRYLVVSKSLPVSVRDFPCNGLIGALGNGSLIAAIANAAAARSGGRLAATQIQADLDALLARSPRRVPYLNGHDVLGVLGELLRTRCGSQAGRADLAASFRAATHCGILNKVPLHGALRSWGASHGLNIWDC